MRLRPVTAGLAVLALLAGSVAFGATDAYAAKKKAYKVTISASATSVPNGSSVTIRGKVALAKKSKRVVKVQYRFAGSKTWKTARSIKVPAVGTYSLATAAIGTVSWRACKAKDSKGKSGCSPAITVSTYTPITPVTEVPTPAAPTTTPPVTPTSPVVNAADASTVPETQGDYGWTSDEARFSQRRREEAAGFGLSATANGTGALAVSAVSPASGPLSGGTTVTLTGAGLDTVTGVKMVKAAWTSPPIGDDAEGQSYAEDSIAVRFKRINATTLQIVTPAWGAGDSQIVAVNGSSNATATYRYERGSGQGTSAMEQAIFNAINTRRSAGVTLCGNSTTGAAAAPALTVQNTAAADYARAYANDLVTRNSIYSASWVDHKRRGALESGDAQVGTATLKAGYGQEVMVRGAYLGTKPLTQWATEVVDLWIAETGYAKDTHCRTVMKQSATSASVGVSISDTGTTMVVVGIA